MLRFWYRVQQGRGELRHALETVLRSLFDGGQNSVIQLERNRASWFSLGQRGRGLMEMGGQVSATVSYSKGGRPESIS